MSVRALDHPYVWTCDECGVEQEHSSEDEPPEDWHAVKVEFEEMTNVQGDYCSEDCFQRAVSW